MDLVTIVTPAYNAAAYLSATINSILCQTYPHWELLIIDDCSTDDTVKIASSFLGDQRIRLLRQPQNQGAISARNRGISEAKGRFVAFLDSDDLWRPSKLAVQIDAMRRHHAALSFTSYRVFSSRGIEHGVHIVPEKVSYRDLLRTCSIGCSTVMYDVDQVGKQYFDVEAPPAREDYALWLKISRSFPNATFYGIQEVLMDYRKHEGGNSKNKLEMAKRQWYIYRQIEHINILPSLYYFLNYMCHGVRKHYFLPKIREGHSQER